MIKDPFEILIFFFIYTDIKKKKKKNHVKFYLPRETRTSTKERIDQKRDVLFKTTEDKN